jgi:CMP-N,N'-diacetyllegionaminic acid synthase
LSFLGFIPARGGSKGVPRKNLHPLNGKPLLQYTIEAALNSARLDHVFLSTENNEILSFGKTFAGLDCSYQRPDSLATDTATTLDALLDGIAWLEKERGLFFDHVVLLQPTSPLRLSEDIDAAIDQYANSRSESLIGVNKMIEHPSECLVEQSSSQWSYLIESPAHATRRQDYLDNFYFINGAIYIRKIDALRKERTLIVKGKSELFHMPTDRGIDIDHATDLAIAEAILKSKMK